MTDVQLTADFVCGGLSFDELDRRTRAGTLHRVRRGAYEAADTWPDEPAEQHRSLIDATIRQTPTPAVISHGSAAVLHGLPTWNQDISRVHLTRDNGGRGKVRRYVHLHVAPLPREHVCTVADMEVTSAARTVVDLARTLPMTRAVAVGDAALRRGVSPFDLNDVAAHCQGWPGMTAARRVLDFSDPRSESVGESASRVVLWEAGVAPTELQFDVFDDLGRPVGRSDFAWPARKTLGEFDGLVKYGRLLEPGQTAGDVLVEEKRREDALRDLGWQVVRWLWADLQQPARLRERLERAYARGAR